MFTPAEMPPRIEAVLEAVAVTLAPAGRAEWAAALAPPMLSSGIATPRRIAMFLGQCSEETGGFRVLAEDLDYTSPERIRAVFAAHFPSALAAEQYVRQPERLANFVYANRMGNGPVASGDGWRFRGAGLIQLTGRWAYEGFGRAFGRTPEDAADWLLTPDGAAASACWYWSLRHLNALADAWDVHQVTQLINGGVVNLAARITLCEAALRTFAA